MSKIKTSKDGRILSVTVPGHLMEGKTGYVMAVTDGQNLKLHSSTRHILDLMRNADRGEALGRLLDIADSAGYGLVFPALRNQSPQSGEPASE